jgi:hypothetical protein
MTQFDGHEFDDLRYDNAIVLIAIDGIKRATLRVRV